MAKHIIETALSAASINVHVYNITYQERQLYVETLANGLFFGKVRMKSK